MFSAGGVGSLHPRRKSSVAIRCVSNHSQSFGAGCAFFSYQPQLNSEQNRVIYCAQTINSERECQATNCKAPRREDDGSVTQLADKGYASPSSNGVLLR